MWSCWRWPKTLSVSCMTLFVRRTPLQRVFPARLPCPPRVVPVAVPASALDTSALRALLTSSVQMGGASLGISSMGSPLLRLSVGNATPSQLFSPSTVSHLGSVSKLFPTLLTFMAAESALLSLDAPLTSLLPSFRVLRPDGSPGGESLVSLRSLLGQVSGLQRDIATTPNTTTDSVLKGLAWMPLLWPPYERPSYSNLAFSLVGRGLEQQFSMSFEKMCDQKIVFPLNLSSTGFYYPPELFASMALGYLPGGGTISPGAPAEMLGWSNPAGGAHGNVEELLVLLDALQRDGVLLGPAARREMLRPMMLNGDAASGFGTPWEMQVVEAAPGTSFAVATKGGNLPGYSSLVAVVPELNISIAVLWNSGVDEAGVGRSMLEALLPQIWNYTLANQPAIAAPGPDFFTEAFGEYGAFTTDGTSLGANISLVSAPATGVVTLMRPNQPSLPLAPIGRVQGVYLLRVPLALQASCQGEMENALLGQAVRVMKNNDLWQFDLPGFLPGIIFTKLGQ